MNSKNSSIPQKPEPQECIYCHKEVRDWHWDEGLTRHDGSYYDGFHPGWKLNECSACQTRREEEGKKLRDEMEIKKRQERIDSLFRNSMVRPRFQDKTFDNYEIQNKKQEFIVRQCRRFCDEFDKHLAEGTWLMFMGNTGTGKGHLASAVIHEIVKQQRFALYIKMIRLLRRVKETWARDSEYRESEIVSELESVDLLVVDEVGIQFGTETERQIIYDIFDGRYELKKPLIMTTNESLERIEQMLGNRIVDRFFEGDNKIYKFDWESYRKIKK